MGSLSDGMDIDIEVRRRGNGYIFIAYEYGVVVRSQELKSGIEELERRLAIIGEDLREVGLPVRSAARAKEKSEIRLFEQLKPLLVIVLTVAAILAALVFLATAPIISALASVRSAISTLIPGDEGSGIAGAGRLGVNFIIKVSQTIEQVTPERKEELRTAIRKIAREADLIIEDVKAAQPLSPQPPPNVDRR